MKKFQCISVAAAAVAFVFAFNVLPVSAEANASYEQVVSVQGAGTELKLDPTFILEPESFTDIRNAGGQTSRPAVVIVQPDAQMNVSLGGETKTLGDAFDDELKGIYIPAVRLDASTVDAFIDWMTDTYYVSDIMAVSDDIEVIEKLYADEVCYIVNTVYDLTSVEIGADRYALWPYIGEANAAGCNILLLDASDENIGVAAEYVAAMSKVCWASASSVEEAVSAIAAGCYGVVSASAEDVAEAAALFTEDGFARAQFVSAHRGITAYANENSLTAIAAAANEGATHVEVDVQVTADGQFILCHDSDASPASTAPAGTWCAVNPSRILFNYKLDDYSELYDETFPTLEEVIEVILQTDLIMMLELKLDNGSSTAVDSLKAIENLEKVMAQYPEMEGHWFAITFFAPYARQMREFMPEIPVGFIGYANADNGERWSSQPSQTEIASKIEFLRQNNVLLDETMSSTPESVKQAYLARGYVQNSWTYSDTSHLLRGLNIATTDAAEEVSMLVKEVCPAGTLSLTEAQLSAGVAEVPCLTYCGWQVERECEIIEVSRSGNDVLVLLYYQEGGTNPYGIYSNLISVTVE